MGIELYFSNKLEILASRLSDLIFAELREQESLLWRPLILVPNQNLARWVQIEMARLHGVSMNLDFRFLERGLFDLMTEQVGKEDFLFSDKDLMQLAILRIFRSEDLYKLPLFKNYLQGGLKGGEAPIDAPQRFMDLSGSLAQLLEAYEFHRFELVETWWVKSDQILSQTALDEASLEDQTAYLYCKAQEMLAGVPARGLFQLSRLLSKPRHSTQSQVQKSVFLIGFSQVSRFHMRLLDQLRTSYDFHIFTLNPCQEYWEDLETPRERGWRQRREDKLRLRTQKIDTEEVLVEEGDVNSLLSLWGRPGREGIRLQCQLTDCDFQDFFEEPVDPTRILHRIQKDILNFALGAKPGVYLKPDDSLVIFSAPTCEREVEAVYNSILSELESHPELSQSDIAILVPEITEYRPIFEDVFSRSYPRAEGGVSEDSISPLSFNLVDMQADTESHYARVVLDFLDLVRGEFNREALFKILSNPCSQERWGFCEEELQTWSDWLDKLGCYRGFDEQSFSFRSGIGRLLVSLVLPGTGGTSLVDSPEFGGHVSLPTSLNLQASEVECFSSIIEVLYSSSLALSKPRSASQWVDDLQEVLHSLFEVPPTARGESAVQSGFLKSLESLRPYCELEQKGGVDSLDFDLIQLFVAQCLSGISGGTGDYLVRGITISALQPMRPIPFQIIYILGLNEENFPGRFEDSGLDLRQGTRCIGDLTTPERNRYLFLEILLSARQSLRLGFVDRDLKKDQVLHKSPVLEELTQIIRDEILEPVEGKPQDYPITQIPLHRFHPDSMSASDGGVLNEVSPLEQLCYHLRVSSPGAESCLRRFSKRYLDLSQNLTLSKLEAGRDEDDGLSKNLHLSSIKSYLSNPWVAHAGLHHRIYENTQSIEEAWMENAEPILLDNLGARPLLLARVVDVLKSVFQPASSQNVEPKVFEGFKDILIQEHEILERGGSFPTDSFALLDQVSQLNIATGLLASLKNLFEEFPIKAGGETRFRSLLIGESSVEPDGDDLLEIRRVAPLEMEFSFGSKQMPHKLSLDGRLDWCWKSSDESWHCLNFHNASDTYDSHLLNPVLFHLLGLNHPEFSVEFSETPLVIHTLTRKGVSTHKSYHSPDFADSYLKSLLSEMLNPNLPPYFPLKLLQSIQVLLPASPDSEKSKQFNFLGLEDWQKNLVREMALRMEPKLSKQAIEEGSDPIDLLFRLKLFESSFASLDDESKFSMQPTAFERMILERELTASAENCRIFPKGSLAMADFRVSIFRPDKLLIGGKN
jgi:exonuclease V gamma subunit